MYSADHNTKELRKTPDHDTLRQLIKSFIESIRESQYQAENNKLHWMTREEDIKGKEAVLSQREDDLRMKEMRLQEATSVKASFEENEGGIKRREGEVKAREPQYQDEDTTLNELSSLKNALLNRNKKWIEG